MELREKILNFVHLEICTSMKSDAHALHRYPKKEAIQVIRCSWSTRRAQNENSRLNAVENCQLARDSYDLINRSKIVDERDPRPAEVNAAPEAGSPACPSLRTGSLLRLRLYQLDRSPSGSHRDRALISISFRPTAASPLFFYYPPRNERMLTRQAEIIAPITSVPTVSFVTIKI